MIKKIILGTLAALVLAALGIMLYVNRAYEQPEYTVVKAEGGVELREYPAHVVAEVTLPGTMDTKMNDAFRILAGYIFGNNIKMTAPVTSDASEKIDMTSPVTGVQDDDSFKTTFVMPKAYTLKTLPKPKDERITLRQLPQRRVLAYRFSGLMTEESRSDALARILAFAVNNDINLNKSVEVAYYDNPYTTLPWLRHNEVMVQTNGTIE